MYRRHTINGLLEQQPKPLVQKKRVDYHTHHQTSVCLHPPVVRDDISDSPTRIHSVVETTYQIIHLPDPPVGA
ncbi:hypothetical protein TNCV_4980601 [Trichonephila clavipes]|nr:hypothetical protein TNCV_4980601 [Trichonephila clavipes]